MAELIAHPIAASPWLCTLNFPGSKEAGYAVRKLRLLSVTGLLVVGGCAGGGGETAGTDAVVATTQLSTTTSTLPPVEMSVSDESRLEAALASQDLDEFTSAFSPVVAEAILTLQYPVYQAGLPEGSTVDIDLTTFVATSADSAVVNATVVGDRSQEWVLFLQKVGDQWLVYGTKRGITA